MASNHNVLPLFIPLAEIIEGEIVCDEVSLEQGSRDNSFVTVPPQAIVFPKHTADIIRVLTFAREYRIPLSVCGNKQGTSGGALTEGIQINLSKHFSKVQKVDIKNNTAVVQAGATIGEVVARFTELGVRCPILSFETYGRTIGGLVAENATTQASATHSDIRSWIQELTFLLDNGEEHALKENATPTGRLLEIYENIHPLLRAQSGNLYASHNRMLTSTSGYNVWNQSVGLKQMLDIVVGSEGTLGVITSVTLRVVPLTKHTYTLVTGVSSLTEAHKVADIYKHHNCDTLSLSDSSLFKEDSIPQGTHVPSFIQNLRSPYLLTGTFIAKEESVVHRTTHMCKEKIEKLCKEVSIEQGSTWASHKDTISTSVLKNFAEKKYSIITTFDSISLPHNSYATCSEKIATFLEEVGCAYTLGGHIGSSQLSVIFFTDTSIHLGKEIMESVSKTITDIVESVHGSITGGNGDGIIRTPCINVSSDTHIRNLYREIQQLFDPEQIFNAGKKTFLTSGYTLRHTHNPKA